ncbi:MAG: SAM-dependent methyltransferase [Syntrophorhabdaceae bacterium]|nr:SAM-dependent methyltransferase [Syntrophorhabdaceae bacterium]
MADKKAALFNEIINSLRSTIPGQERNMYPYVKDLFMHAFGYKSNQILTDVTGASGKGIPDLSVKVPSGVKGHDKKDLMLEKIVIEVKDEPGTFQRNASRNAIFREKSKYVGVDTTHFVMIDPSCMVIRPVWIAEKVHHGDDTVIDFDGELSIYNIREKAAQILSENTGISRALKRFREGDTSTIAVVKLNGDSTRPEFFSVLRKCSSILQGACLEAFGSHLPEMQQMQDAVNVFSEKYQGCSITFSPLKIQGRRYQIPNDVGKHARDVNGLKRVLSRNLPIARLTVEGFPAFKARFGVDEDSKKGKEKISLLFSIETANLIFARLLMIRFLEDHGFFGDDKYVCNGGVAAYQGIIRHFKAGYTKLLKDAYEKASSLYQAVFDENDLDWVFGSNNERLSAAIELAMYFLSRFDFSTVRGDILSGIYDRFLEGSQRKVAGEYYTPPSIARYIVDAVGITPTSRVFDPACGSGTFLVEAYQKMVGDRIDRGLAGYDEAALVFENLAGNDLNPLSAVIAQMQVLWHILVFKNELMAEGFPDIRITEKVNSLVIPDALLTHSELDVRDYDAVIGNPPYVRPERLKQRFDSETAGYFDKEISADMNLYCLFLYRALNSWCRDGGDETPPGRLGFVLPLSFCDGGESGKLRALFRPDSGKWTILEIVDMEIIAPYVFDAAVNPMILIAENRPPRADDTVIVRIAGDECVVLHEEEKGLATFDLSRAMTSEFAYPDIFTGDGRILTKITGSRLGLIRKIGGHKKFEDIVDTIWVRKEKRNRIVEWQPRKPIHVPAGETWEEVDLLRRGCVFRGKKEKASDTGGEGFDVFKGENISACVIEGDPQDTGIDVDSVDDASLWRFRTALPEKGYAFLRICSSPTCVSFDPSKMIFMDTSTLFFPGDRYREFPFDLLILSRIYRYYHGVALRLGMVEDLWSDMYPSNLRLMPWTDELLPHASAVESMRQQFLNACQNMFKRLEFLLVKLKDEISSASFKDIAGNMPHVKVKWGESFEKESNQVLMGKSSRPGLSTDIEFIRIQAGDDIFAYVDVNDGPLANRLASVLGVFEGQKLSRREILDIPIPADDDNLARFNEIVARSGNGDSLEAIYDRLDAIVGPAFGLTQDEILLIQQEMREDHFLKHLQPKLPFSKRKMRGFLEGLESSDRYER